MTKAAKIYHDTICKATYKFLSSEIGNYVKSGLITQKQAESILEHESIGHTISEKGPYRILTLKIKTYSELGYITSFQAGDILNYINFFNEVTESD